MLTSLFQKIDIIEQTKKRLLLRELPRMEWFFSAIVLMLGINMAIFGLNLTAAVAIALGLIVGFGSRIRIIVFDVQAEEMVIVYQYPLRRVVVNTTLLEEVTRAYLSTAEDNATQVILLTQQGEMGLSVYSKDARPWKEVLVFAINEFLHHYRKHKEQAAEDDLREAL